METINKINNKKYNLIELSEIFNNLQANYNKFIHKTNIIGKKPTSNRT
jgi:hypothetical protein